MRTNSKRPAPSPLTLYRLVDGISARVNVRVFLFLFCPELPGPAHAEYSIAQFAQKVY